MANSLYRLTTHLNRLWLGVALGCIGVCLTLLPTLTSAAVSVSSFKVQLQSNQVQLTWRTASEVNNAGFNILRSTSAGGPYQKINSSIIPPKFVMTGADYSFNDPNVTSPQTYYYKLQAVATNGGTQEFGPQSASLGNPAPTVTNTPVPSATKTNTPIPGTTNTPAPSITKTNTPAPTSAGTTPTRTATPSAQVKSASPALSPTKVAIAVVPAQPAQPSANAQVPPAPSTDNNVDSAPAVTPQSESTEDGSMAEDNSVAEDSSTIDEQVVADDAPNWTRILLSASFFGLAGLLGLGGLVLSAATIYFLLSPSKR